MVTLINGKVEDNLRLNGGIGPDIVENTYMARRGDTVKSIACNFGMNPTIFCQLNNCTIDKKVSVGEEFTIYLKVVR